MKMTRWMARVAGVAVLVTGLGGVAAPAAAQSEGRIVGRVTDDVGRPVEGARVVLAPADSAAPARAAVSGATGGFEFAALPPGAYTLRAGTAGSASRELRVTVAPGERQTLIARLQRRRGEKLAEGTSRPGRGEQ
jgi:protocatechuate 3,4-dioxygenase beta subunit